MRDVVILVTNFGMGKADEKLQLSLIAKYFELIIRNGSMPSAICFYTDGAKLVCEGSPVIEQLQALESRNVRLIICSTCLNYFGLADKVQVGIVGGMGDILEAQMKAENVVSI
jgi:sulfur relay (sulfurtransferase) complex TusBCD TusD component (DsrE family)